MNYTNYTFSELVEKIGSSRFWDLPKMLEDILRRLVPQEPKYKVYTALLTQTGTDAPVATVLENTLDFTPSFIYSDIGVYIVTPLEDIASFQDKKVLIFLNKGGSDSTNSTNSISCSYNYEAGELEIRTYADGVASDDILSDFDMYQKTSIEIRVYN